ncbi:MAG: GNAT family N-acetyltransferase [Terrisporobacter sp.]
MIIIKKLENKLIKDLRSLQMTEFQKNYVHIDFDDMLNKIKNNSDMNLYLVCNDDVVIGFACILLDEEGDLNLLKFMIDYNYQGKGYAKQALLLLLDLIKSQAPKDEVWLSVHPNNTKAVDLYKKIGFTQQQTKYDADDEIFFKYVY